MKKLILPLCILCLVLGFGWTATRVLEKQSMPEPAIRSLKGPQQAYVPYGFPQNTGSLTDTKSGQKKVGQFDPRMMFHDCFDRFLIPQAPRFDFPMGVQSGAMTYNAQKFWENNGSRGGYHTGDDINGIGGQNSDLGDPVYAIANGLVVYTGVPAEGWGNVVVLAHKDKNGRLLHSMYAHLEHIVVSQGRLLGRGEKLGSVGTAGGAYLAHLHLELHHSDGVRLGRGYTKFRLDRLNPSEQIIALRGVELENVDRESLGYSAVHASKQREDSDRVLPTLDAEGIRILSELGTEP